MPLYTAAKLFFIPPHNKFPHHCFVSVSDSCRVMSSLMCSQRWPGSHTAAPRVTMLLDHSPDSVAQLKYQFHKQVVLTTLSISTSKFFTGALHFLQSILHDLSLFGKLVVNFLCIFFIPFFNISSRCRQHPFLACAPLYSYLLQGLTHVHIELKCVNGRG